MNGYTKLFASIVTSTVWGYESGIKVVWITMMAVADQHGEVQASVPGLAKLAGEPRDVVERALAIFLAPDPDSRTKEHEGRRIIEVDGGWALLNHPKYRDKQSKDDRLAKAAVRQRRFRDAKSLKPGEIVTPVTPSNALRNASSRSVTPSNAIRSISDQTQSKADPEEKRTAPQGVAGLRIPEGYEPRPETVKALEQEGVHDPLSCLPSFRDYWLAKAGKDGAKRDWDATFRVWVRRDKAPRANGRIVQQAPPGGPKYTIGYLNLDGDES